MSRGDAECRLVFSHDNLLFHCQQIVVILVSCPKEEALVYVPFLFAWGRNSVGCAPGAVLGGHKVSQATLHSHAFTEG